jgi:hypothetical protein
MLRRCAAVVALLVALSVPPTPAADRPDLTKQPTLYVVGYAHLDTEWRWEYPQVINEYFRKTMEDNFSLFEKYPHYVFNFSGANRYRFMKEYFPADFAKVKRYVDSGRWYPAGSSMEEGDVNAPSAEAIIRQILYGNNWFRKELGKASAEYMLPDCFGFPASLPSILAHYGSNKPNDHTIRLTLIRTPGTRGGYADQGTQDLGHHEFVYGIAGHAAGWRQAGTDWQAQRLNDPLIAFETPHHAGALGRQFSLLSVSSSRIRLLALKKAEQADELIARLVELDGRPRPNVRISFAVNIAAAREVNGQEQPVGPATVSGGALVTSFTAYQPRTFAIRLAAAATQVAAVRSTPVTLRYDLATASHDGTPLAGGFDGKGDALPAEMLPEHIAFNNVGFRLAPTNAPNAVLAKGQTTNLPTGSYNKLYVLAASAGGDQIASFQVGSQRVSLNIRDWGGFIGQWDDRRWAAKEMTGIEPGYIKRTDLAWYCSHHHNVAGQNVPYAYSYLFVYSIELPPAAKTITLPDNDKIRILAISVADENPVVKPAQPLYDELRETAR